jgi:hypothetical protein
MTLTVNMVQTNRHLHCVVHLVKTVWQADELKCCNAHSTRKLLVYLGISVHGVKLANLGCIPRHNDMQIADVDRHTNVWRNVSEPPAASCCCINRCIVTWLLDDGHSLNTARRAVFALLWPYHTAGRNRSWTGVDRHTWSGGQLAGTPQMPTATRHPASWHALDFCCWRHICDWLDDMLFINITFALLICHRIRQSYGRHSH